MKFRNISFRLRVALLMIGVSSVSSLLMGVLSVRLMRIEFEDSSLAYAADAACTMVNGLKRDGITVEKLQKNPELIAQFYPEQETANQYPASPTVPKIEGNPGILRNFVIAVPEGDQWRIIARHDPHDSTYVDDDQLQFNATLNDSEFARVGSIIRVEPIDQGTAPISTNRRSSGWYKTSFAKMFGAIEPLADQGGILFVGARKHILFAHFFDDIVQTILIAVGGVALLAVIVSWLISKRLVRPFRDLSEFGAALDAGKFDHRLPVRGPPEIEIVIKELNTFAKNLGQRRAMSDLEINFYKITDFGLLMGQVLENLPQVIHAPICCVFLPDGADFVLAYATRSDEGKEAGTSFIGYIAQRTGLLAQVIEHTTITVDKLNSSHGSLVEAAGIVGAAATAIAMKSGSGETLGVLLVTRQPNATHATFTKEENADLLHVATLISTALERRALKEKMMWSKVRMAESRDPSETGPHVKRVSATALEIFDGWAKRIGMREKESQFPRENLRMAAILHDVGKIGISDLILKKPEKLTQEEYEIMKHHSVLGVPHLPGDYSEDDRQVALHHHERWDGRGYPGTVSIEHLPSDDQSLLEMQLPSTGMKGDDIPLFARMVAIADVFDALSSHRAYKQAWSPERVEAEMRNESGKAFDPELIEIFFERLDRIRAVRARHPDQIAKPQA